MIFLIAIFCSLLIAIYFYLTWNFDYWKKQGIPCPKGTKPLLGDFPNEILRKKNVHYDIEKIYNEFKGKTPFVGYIQTRTAKLMLLEPEIIKDVLIRKFNAFRNNEFGNLINAENDPLFAKNPFFLRDDEWKEKRAEITPAFTNNRLKALFPIAQDVLDRMIKYVKNETKTLNARELSAKFTVDVVSSAIYGIDAGSFKSENSEVRTMARKLIDPAGTVIFKLLLATSFPILKKIIDIRFTTPETQKFFTSLMEQALEYREKNNVHREDFLDYVINLRKKKHISEVEMASHTISFFTDGTETSSIAISNAIYELAKNKRVQDKLREEVNKHVDENGVIGYDTLHEIPYLDQVFYEALRLHSPATFTNRICEEETTLEYEGKRVKIEKGVSVLVPIQAIHLDSNIFVEPNKFYPERFDDGALKDYRDRCVLLAFGDGPRICLGMRFALMQSKLALAGLVQNFEMSVNPKTKDNPLIIDPKEFLNVKVGGFWIDFKAIN